MARGYSKRAGAIILAAVAAMALLWAGCGSGDDETTATLTKAQLIARGDAICKAGDKKQELDYATYLQENRAKNGQFTEDEQEKLILAVGLPPVQEEVEKLRDLGAPQGEEEKVEAIVDGLESAVAKAEEDPNSITSETGNPFSGVEQMARGYGFKVCGQV